MRTFLASTLLLALAACTGSSLEHDMDPSVGPQVDLNVLLGEWQDVQDSGRTVFNEHWVSGNNGSLIGLGFVMSGMDTVFIEHLAILKGDSLTHYSATIRSQNDGEAVLFELVHQEDSLVFSNPGHDFPQRIVYAPMGEDELHVTISGVVEGRNKTGHYNFSRRTNDAPAKAL